MHSRVAPIRPAGVPTGISSHGGISLPVGPKHAVRLGGYQDAIGRGQFPGYGCLASLGSQERNRILDAPGVDDIMRLESWGDEESIQRLDVFIDLVAEDPDFAVVITGFLPGPA